MFEDSPSIGIDLGTTRCCVGYLPANNRDVDIIENQHGDRTTPSYVAFTDSNEIIGKLAKERGYRNQINVVFDSKRLIGRNFDDTHLQQNLKSWPFIICPSDDNIPLIEVLRNGKSVTYKPHEISAKLLAYMKNVAETRLGRDVKDAVITVPAYFNYHQRTATKEAGALAGLNVLKIMNEPTAAALAYVHKHLVTSCNNILVFDLGGGTFDVSVVSVRNDTITVKAASGNTYLGGRDFDTNLANYIIQKIERKYGVDVGSKVATMHKINAKAEKLKTELSFETSARLDLTNILNDDRDVEMEITRAEFESVNMNLFELCIKTVEDCLKDARIKKSKIEKVLLIGGSTRIPKLQAMLADYFSSTEKLTQGINPDEAVAYGAAIQAATLKRGSKVENPQKIYELTPLSLGTDIIGNRMSFIIWRNTPIPVTKTKNYMTVSDKQKAMAINIYEGERTLVKYNAKIGTCTIALPPRPPGYPVEVSFHIDENGILEVGARTDTGAYTSLAIEFEKQIAHKTSDALQDALIFKERDDRENQVIGMWIKLKEYCIKMKALCTYKSEQMNETEKNTVIATAEDVSSWVSKHQVESGDDEERNAILCKQNEIAEICEPIVSKYGFRVSDMCISEFYKLITSS